MSFFFLNKGWKFLKKLWCCVGGGSKVIWLYQLSWKCKLATVMSIWVFFILSIFFFSIRVISLSIRLRLITPTSTFIILDITKPSSNNCLKLYIVQLCDYPTTSCCSEQHAKSIKPFKCNLEYFQKAIHPATPIVIILVLLCEMP